MAVPVEAPPRRLDASSLLRYFETTRSDLPSALAATVASRYSSPVVIAGTLRFCEEYDPDRVRTRIARRLAAASPHANADTLHRSVLNRDPLVADVAAPNPALGAERVAELWEATHFQWLLSNPHVDSALLEEHSRKWPNFVAVNPAAPEAILRDREIQKRCLWGVLRNAACPRDILATHLRRTGDSAVASVTNPQLTLDELVELHEWHIDAHGRSSARLVLVAIEQRILEHQAVMDPLAVHTRHLDDVDVLDPLADALADPDSIGAQAVTVLLAGGFDGTIGELLGCAEGITT